MSDDFHPYNRVFDCTMRKLESGTLLSPANRALALRFIHEELAQGRSKGRLLKYLEALRLFDRLAMGKGLDSMSKSDVMDLVAAMETNGYSAWYRHDLRVALKKLFKWMRGDEDYPPEIRWLKTTVKGTSRKLPEELLTDADVLKMIDAADNPRDKALLSVLAESGCRVGEIGTLRIRNVSFDQYGALIVVNGKTGMRRVRLVVSVPYLTTWLEYHPFKSQPEAPLWVSRGLKDLHAPLRYAGIRTFMRVIARRAGIKKRVHAHLFRHSRATQLASKLTEAQLKEMFGWTQSSSQAATYVHLSGRDVDDALLKLHGLKRDETETPKPLQPIQCRRCRSTNAPTSGLCAACGAPLRAEVALQAEAERKTWDDRMSRLVEDPEVRELLLRKLRTWGLSGDR